MFCCGRSAGKNGNGDLEHMWMKESNLSPTFRFWVIQKLSKENKGENCNAQTVRLLDGFVQVSTYFPSIFLLSA